MNPLVSVVLPVCNGMPYIEEAVVSILGQTFADLELVVIDDGSNDGTFEYLSGLTDRRVRLIRHDANRGIVASLNEGLEAAKGRYIARMDGDDISRSDRIAVQVRYLQENPDVVLLGSAIRYIGSKSRVLKPPATRDAIRAAMLFSAVLCHPAVMLDGEVVRRDGLRYPNVPCAEDYALFTSLIDRFEVRCLPDVLLQYRVHSNSIGQSKNARQFASMQGVRRGLLSRWLGIEVSEDELRVHGTCCAPALPKGSEAIAEALRWLDRLAAAPGATAMPGLAAELHRRRRYIARHSPLLDLAGAICRYPSGFDLGHLPALALNAAGPTVPAARRILGVS